jgi:putative nucleotidyltransferase with HDIG domain
VVSRLSASFASFLGRPKAEQHILARAGLLHDIGKLKVPTSILQKPSLLTAEERTVVDAHAQLGHDMLLESGETSQILLTVTRDHHERLDGTGYPRKLTAEQIAMSVRIVTLCDVFAAMTEVRPYAEPMTWEEALEAMARKRTRLDLDLLSEFVMMLRAMNASKQRFSSFFKRRAS